MLEVLGKNWKVFIFKFKLGGYLVCPTGDVGDWKASVVKDTEELFAELLLHLDDSSSLSVGDVMGMVESLETLPLIEVA